MPINTAILRCERNEHDADVPWLHRRHIHRFHHWQGFGYSALEEAFFVFVDGHEPTELEMLDIRAFLLDFGWLQ